MPGVTLIAGVPSDNMTLFHRTRLAAHDPAALIIASDGAKTLICRDVELERARTMPAFDHVYKYEDFEPDGGLPAERALKAAQSFAECVRRMDATRVTSDRTLALIYVEALKAAGIEVVCDHDLGTTDRRCKSAEEIECLREATRITESAIELACTTIARADAGPDGILMKDGEPLTAERVRGMAIAHLAQHGAITDAIIVAGGPQGADCHNAGAGSLRTGEAIIIDIFPKVLASGYHGDCTRCVVHGEIPAEVRRMHETVKSAKAACIAAVRAGTTADAAHAETVRVITEAGYAMGFPDGPIPMQGPPTGFCSMPHGTGHGLGLELKEPPLVDVGGPAFVVGDAVTIEPGLYAPGLGGIRLEDLIIVTETGSENLNALHEELDWR